MVVYGNSNSKSTTVSQGTSASPVVGEGYGTGPYGGPLPYGGGIAGISIKASASSSMITEGGVSSQKSMSSTSTIKSTSGSSTKEP